MHPRNTIDPVTPIGQDNSPIPAKSTIISIKKAAVKYAELVREFAHLPDGRGANHALLMSFFGKLTSHWSSSQELPDDEEYFALAYIFDKEDDAKHSTEARWTLSKAVEYESCLKLVIKTSSETSKSRSRLLFLRGFPSVEWLGLIGARYRVDSELFMRFLHFKPGKDATPNYSLPALPTASWNILEIPIITIGEKKVLPGIGDQSEIQNMRKEARSKLQEHHHLLRGNDGVPVASSIVREVTILDHSCFALEQRIWICLEPLRRKDSDSGRWTLVVWTDSGCTPSVKSVLDLNILPTAFQTGATSLLPVIDYKPGTGLAAQKFTSHGYVHVKQGAEAASQLCVGYGRTLYEDVMASDPLYALTEVFNMTTASVNQYLNMIEYKLAESSDHDHPEDFAKLSNLRYLKDILYRQQKQVEQVHTWLKLHQLVGGMGWRTVNEEDPKASHAAKSVVQRYEYLQTRVKTLQAECQDAISNLMNYINSKDVRNSYEQSRRVGKLTFLAFLFAPLSFTTSFFAMDIGLKNLNLRTWFEVTISLLVVTFLVLSIDTSGWTKLARDSIRSATTKAQYI
ncbi:hypothetical protein EV127DRAFT_376072 [Xylaria flabelliformis]|nr:hypothetical protein EV127DRAFT_376072 [Xylaria flabelliformis]